MTKEIQNNKQEQCLNCEHGFSSEEDFCPDCGQKNINRSISFKDLMIDFFGDYFAFDSKFFNTMKPLFFKPGMVALDFVEGHRVRHIPPLRILIFSSFIFFFVIGIMPADDSESLPKEGKISLLDGASLTFFTPAELDSIKMNADKMDLTLTQYLEQDTSISDFVSRLVIMPDFLNQGYSPEQFTDSICKGSGFFERRLFTQIAKVYVTDSNTTSNYFTGNLSISILLFQPIFALILFAFYRKRKRFFINHLVFSLYLHAFLILLFTISVILTNIFSTDMFLAISFLVALVYFYFSLKYFYQQKRGITILKTISISLLYLLFLTPLTFMMSLTVSFFFF